MRDSSEVESSESREQIDWKNIQEHPIKDHSVNGPGAGECWVWGKRRMLTCRCGWAWAKEASRTQSYQTARPGHPRGSNVEISNYPVRAHSSRRKPDEAWGTPADAVHKGGNSTESRRKMNMRGGKPRASRPWRTTSCECCRKTAIRNDNFCLLVETKQLHTGIEELWTQISGYSFKSL